MRDVFVTLQHSMDLGFSKIVTIRELAKPQAIPGSDDHVAYIYLSGMALDGRRPPTVFSDW
jgi:hypothetical protein